ncbi:MAG: DNA polymerase I [Pirellulaceae bacterium]|nr:DNA polymerase I [Pirellulaceae bacterium]
MAAIDTWPVPAYSPPPGVTPDLAGQTVVVIDSHSLIYQLFHAMAPMSSPSGFPVSTVFGFLRDVADLRKRLQPSFMWCAFDLSEATFRSEIYEAYKAHREPMPDELRLQIPLIRRGLEALGVGLIGVPGFEADDVLATLAAQIESSNGRCILVTADKDCRQLITERVTIYNIRKDEMFGFEELRAAWGIRPDQVVDFQSLVGDSVDNIPGVPLVGPKLAEQLLNQFGSLENVLANADKVSGQKRQENLRTYRDQALLSRELVRLRSDVPLELDWGSANFSRKDVAVLDELFKELGLRKLSERLLGKDPVPEPAPVAWLTNYRCITTRDQLRELVEQLQRAAVIAFDTETTSTHARDSLPVGYSFAWGCGQAAYIPLRAPGHEEILPLEEVNAAIAPVMADPLIHKVGQNIKFDLIVMRGQNLEVAGLLCDTMVADYLLDPGQRNHSLDDIAKRRLKHNTIPITHLIGSGRHQMCMDQVDLKLISEYASEDADVPWRLTDPLLTELQALQLKELFDRVEMPLVEVLADMEYRGIRVLPEKLSAMSGRFDARIADLRARIVSLAGEEFNPDSPKQLAAILFDKLGLPVIKRTTSGPSTDVEVLQELSEHEIASQLIEYRQLTKLKGTYIDALPKLISARTGRIHTSFRQDVAATGRLSSSDPNLQNIPIRTEEGRHIRSAFCAGNDTWMLMAADYSQIELRVLAHYCRDANLIAAFENDRDIHAQVAAQVYSVPLDEVTSAQRRSAKAINFGIIYGQSPFGLAKALKISKDEAALFIDAYFAGLPGVREFIVETLSQCRTQGWVSTLLGRRRQVKGVRNFRELSEAKRRVLIEPERIAVNTVIQGTAADLIKLAMIHVWRRLKSSGLQANLLLQIHDELIFEVAPEDAQALEALVREEMTRVIQLAVPLKVDIKCGSNWAECE